MSNKVKEPKEGRQLLNVMYFRNDWKNDIEDTICLIYRDEDTNEKRIREINEPKFAFYTLRDEFIDTYHHNGVPIEHTDIVKCRYNSIYDTMAEIVGKKDTLMNWRKTKRASKQKTLHKENIIYNSDVDISDYYIRKFQESYKSKYNKITKSYLDIECDILNYPSFPSEDLAPCPINVITYVDDVTNNSYSFILRNPKNKLIAELENDAENFSEELLSDVFPDYGINKFKLYFYDDEEQLIRGLFKVINKNKPDFNLSWNGRFDIKTMINRLELHMNIPANEVMCHKDFSRKVAYYNTDKIHERYGERNDEFVCSSYTTFLDQLKVYDSLRMTSAKKESYALGDVAMEELGETKIGYNEEDDEEKVDLAMEPYVNFKRFLIYNIKDVLLLKKLEEKNKDLDLLYTISEMTATRIQKCMKKTTSLKNLSDIFFKESGYIMTNNVNLKDWEQQAPIDSDGAKTPKKKVEKFDGALVSEPALNDFCGKKINNKRSKSIFNRVVDADATALYPSIKISTNNDMDTMIGQLQFYKDFEDKDPEVSDRLKKANVRGGTFIDFLQAKDWLTIGTKFMGLPNISEIIKELEERGII